MKIFKRLTFLFLAALTLLVVISFPINVFASDNSFSNFGATYKVTEVTVERDLGYGVKFHRENATLTTNISGISTGVTVGAAAGQQVSVLEFAITDDVKLVPYAYLDSASWVASSVKKAAAHYEVKNPGYRVIAGVNGDFFHINDSVKASTGVTVGQGEFYKSVSNHGAVNTLAIKNTGEGLQLFPTKVNSTVPMLSIYDNEGNVIKKVQINKVNAEPGEGEISLYYAQRETSFGNKVIPVKVSDAYFVRKGDPAVTALKNSFYGVGLITEFTSSEIELIQGQFAIKCNNNEIKQLLNPEVKIRCQYEYNDPSLAGVEDFIGYPYQIITNSEPWKEVQTNVSNAMYRHPRTIVGQKANGEIVLAVVDGRQNTKNMYGATSVEMSALMGYYGCVDAWNLDGGGSSTMIVRRQEGWDFTGLFDDPNSNWHITNSPSDGNERSDGNHLFVVVKAPEVEFSVDEVTETSITLNVALLTDINKYTELYILANGKFNQVKDGKVTIKGLKKNTSYQFELFNKVDDQMVDLMTPVDFKTSKPAPTELTVRLDLYEKNGVEYILIRYKLDASDAVKAITLFADDKYLTAGESVLIEKTQAFYDALTNAEIQIKYNVNELFEDQIATFTGFEVTVTVAYSFDELEYSFDSFVKDLFQ